MPRRPVVCALFVAALALLSYNYFTTIYHKVDGVERGHGRYRPILAVQDGHKIYLQVMSVVYDHDLDITDEVKRWGYPGFRWETDGGRPIYPHAIGPVIVWAPALAIAHDASKVAGIFGHPVASHGYTYFHQRIVFFTSVLAAWLACLLGWRVAREVVGGRAAPLLASLAVLFGTAVYYYAVHRPDYGHALSALAGAGFLGAWALTVGDRSLRRFVHLGGLLGIAGLVRSANLALGIVVAVELCAALIRELPEGERLAHAGRLALRGLVALAAAFVLFLPQLLVWKYHYESGFFHPPHGGSYVHLGRPMLPELLFSRLNSFFAVHPLAYAGTLGLFLLPKRHRLVGVGLFAAVAAEAYLNSCVYDWWGMGSYGARRMCVVTLALVVGLAALLRAAGIAARFCPRIARLGLGVLFLGWFVVWNLEYATPARERLRVEPLKMCCDEVPGFMQKLAEPIYRRVGNPFMFPANLAFARRWDVSIKKWSEVVLDTYADWSGSHELASGKARGKEHHWNIPGVNFDPFVARGFGPHLRYRLEGDRKDRWVRWARAPGAAVFVPLFFPCDHRFQIPVRPNLAAGDPPVRVRLAVNGVTVADRELGPGWHQIRFTVPAAALHRGTNLLSFYGPPPAPARTGKPKQGGLPDKGAPVSLAVGMARIWVLDIHR